MNIDRSQLFKRLDTSWEALKASYAGLSDSELLEPGVTGAWSVRDIIAHVTWWEEEALTHLPLILAGGKPPRYSVKYGGIDAFNSWMTEQKRSLLLSDVLLPFAAYGGKLNIPRCLLERSINPASATHRGMSDRKDF